MIRKLLLVSAAAGGLLAAALPASAADLRAVPAPAPVYVAPVPVYTWTGFYIGGNAGAAWHHRDDFFSDPALYPAGIGFPNGFGCGTFNCDNNRTVFTGGGQIGFNWQYNQFVWGIEGDVEYVGNARRNNNGVTFTLPPGSGLPPGTYTAFFSGNDNNNVLGTIRGRFGVALDRWLVFGSGGVAFRGNNGDSIAFVNNAAGITVASFSCGGAFNCNNDNTVGWAAGGGVQYAITDNVSIGVEYLHAGFDSGDRIDPILSAFNGTPTISNRGNRDIDIVRGRLDFKFGGLFGWGP